MVLDSTPGGRNFLPKVCVLCQMKAVGPALRQSMDFVEACQGGASHPMAAGLQMQHLRPRGPVGGGS